MPRYIDAERFKLWLQENYVMYDGDRYFNDIDAQPTADVVDKERYDRLLENSIIIADALRKYQSADMVEVKHGKWVKQFDENCWWYECSECGDYPLKSVYGNDQLSDFCPWCGADMRGEEE